MEVTYVLLPAADQFKGQTGAVLTVDLEIEEEEEDEEGEETDQI